MVIKQATISVCVGAVFLALSFLLGGAVYFAQQADQRQLTAFSRQVESRQLGLDLAAASDFLTDEARKYVVTADASHYQAYWKEIEVSKNRERVLVRLGELGTPQAELDLIALAKKNSDALVSTETRAMRLVLEATATPESQMHPAIAAFKLNDADRARTPDEKLATARAIMFDAQYARDKALIMGPITEFQQRMNARLESDSEAAGQATNRIQWVLGMIAIVLPLGIGGSLWLLYCTPRWAPRSSATSGGWKTATGTTRRSRSCRAGPSSCGASPAPSTSNSRRTASASKGIGASWRT
jgi:hypothetical protein